MTSKAATPTRTEDEIRELVHRYFHERYQNGTSERGKKGIAATISVIKRDLKDAHGLSPQEVARSISYLIDQGWIRKDEQHKQFTTKTGTTMPSVTTFYRIDASGVDKIEGGCEYTSTKFSGINIEATGQNLITIGDNNQINSTHKQLADNLLDLKSSVKTSSELTETQKLDLVADLDTIESQLAKSKPNPTVIDTLWKGVSAALTGTSLAANCVTIGTAITALLG
jgi:hypothetical protein